MWDGGSKLFPINFYHYRKNVTDFYTTLRRQIVCSNLISCGLVAFKISLVTECHLNIYLKVICDPPQVFIE